jgi:hypothetical protein
MKMSLFPFQYFIQVEYIPELLVVVVALDEVEFLLLVAVI